MSTTSTATYKQQATDPGRISIGVSGLDEILNGGLPPHHVYLVAGDPGTGKTTLGLQFLLAGVARGETVLHIALSETKDEIVSVAASHGWNADGINIYELGRDEQGLGPEKIGTGLGLWVSKDLIEKNGGRIHYRSSTASQRPGTTFSIFLPDREQGAHD